MLQFCGHENNRLKLKTFYFFKKFSAFFSLLSVDLMLGNNYKKYCHPRQPYIIERYRALKRIPAKLRAIRVVLIPVDARRIRR